MNYTWSLHVGMLDPLQCEDINVLTLALWIVFVSTQLLLFHGIYCIYKSSPLGSLCMTMVYALAFYCPVTIIATTVLGGIIL